MLEVWVQLSFAARPVEMSFASEVAFIPKVRLLYQSLLTA